VSTFEVLSRDQITKILGTVAHEKAFFFYEEIGKPVGDFATSLTDLCGKINTVPSTSLSFHLKRGDFENWTKNAMGDGELSNRIAKARKAKTTWKNDAILRKKLYATVRDRITELQDLWRHALTWSEGVVA
jgi:hypothetical protein